MPTLSITLTAHLCLQTSRLALWRLLTSWELHGLSPRSLRSLLQTSSPSRQSMWSVGVSGLPASCLQSIWVCHLLMLLTLWYSTTTALLTWSALLPDSKRSLLAAARLCCLASTVLPLTVQLSCSSAVVVILPVLLFLAA